MTIVYKLPSLWICCYSDWKSLRQPRKVLGRKPGKHGDVCMASASAGVLGWGLSEEMVHDWWSGREWGEYVRKGVKAEGTERQEQSL